jgi:hypothetical protein
MHYNKLIVSLGLMPMFFGLNINHTNFSPSSQPRLSQDNNVIISHRGSGRKGGPEGQNGNSFRINQDSQLS